MPAEDCGPRIQELGSQLRDLRARESELEELANSQSEAEVSDELLEEVESELEAALLGGTPAQKKAALRKVVFEIETDGKRAWPRYRVPVPAVRKAGTLVERSGFEPPTSSVRGRRSPS